MAAAPGSPETFLARHKEACGKFDEIASLIDELYEFCCPLRERPYSAKTASARRTDRLFDNTAVNALADFASQRMEDVWPTDQKPFDLLPGPGVADEDREEFRRVLAGVASELIETVNLSNFRAAGNEAALDYGLATGVMLIEEGDALEPLRHRALPISEARLWAGPYGDHDGLSRTRKVKAGHLKAVWPDGKFTAEMLRDAAESPDKDYEFVEGHYRDWSRPMEEVWIHCVCAAKEKHEIARSEAKGVGSKPFITFSFMRVCGETYGRGPAQLVLPDIRSANVVRQLLLEHLDISIGGLWQYESHGVVNADTISIEAGTVYPRMPNTKGLESVPVGGNPQFGEVELQALQQSIERGFFKLDLGPVDKTPKSATEILQRVADRAGRLSGPNARLTSEFLIPYIRRGLWILRKKGRIEKWNIDARTLAIRPLAPITRAQAQDDILRHVRLMEFLNQMLGPQIANMVVDGVKMGDYLAGKMGTEPSVRRTSIERQELAKAMAQLAATAQQQEAA